MSNAAPRSRVDKKVTPAVSDSANGSANSNARHGRTKVSAKAISRIVAAVAGEAFGVPARSVGVQLDDSSGMLAVTATTGITVRSLVPGRVSAGSSQRSGQRPTRPGSVLERATAAQSEIRTRTGELTGSLIGPVTVRLNSAIIEGEDRAR